MPTSSETLENLFLQAQQNFGNINLIVNSRTQRTQDFDSDVQSLGKKLQLVFPLSLNGIFYSLFETNWRNLNKKI